ncbi:hypothetical protein MEO40_24845, partial [Dolichospermum sp. ST_sed1]|nr:hypothetical protein [Dolichospermum sp. ST_sed1]
VESTSQEYPEFPNSKAVMKKDSKPLLPPVSFPSQGAKPLSFPLIGYYYDFRYNIVLRIINILC